MTLIDDEGNLGGEKDRKSEKQYSRLQKMLRKAGGELGEVLVGQLEREGRGVRVKGRGKIGGWHRFPFIIPTNAWLVNRRRLGVSSATSRMSFFFSSTTIYMFKPQLRPKAPPS